MTRTEVVDFMKVIKAYYQNFLVEDYVVDEWYKQLSKYEKDDVYEKFEEHLKSDYQTQPPKLHYITKYLKTPEEKEKTKQVPYLVACNLCGKYMTLDEYNEHYDKCLAEEIVYREILREGTDIGRDELKKLSRETLNDIYKKAMARSKKLREQMKRSYQ